MLHQSTHSALQYSLQATRFLDGIFSTLASDLRTREPTRPRSTETDGPDPASLLAAASTISAKPRADPINMLRALAAAEQKQQDGEGLAAAKRVQPVSSLGMSTSTAPTSIPPAQTPRRAGATPRRAGALGASTSTQAGPSVVSGKGRPQVAE
jgi:kinetochore protein Mis13/DSN1